jgi:hypothetical protein
MNFGTLVAVAIAAYLIIDTINKSAAATVGNMTLAEWWGINEPNLTMPDGKTPVTSEQADAITRYQIAVANANFSKISSPAPIIQNQAMATSSASNGQPTGGSQTAGGSASAASNVTAPAPAPEVPLVTPTAENTAVSVAAVSPANSQSAFLLSDPSGPSNPVNDVVVTPTPETYVSPAQDL